MTMAGSEEDREQLKIFRSPNASFERDAQNATTVYTEHVLSGLADSDFNGIWIRGIFYPFLRHPAFPEFGADAKGLQASLETVISRAACHGIKVYIYHQEPLGLPVEYPFWQKNAALGGTQSACRFHNRTAGSPRCRPSHRCRCPGG